MRRALCLGADSDLWFGGNSDDSSTAARLKREAVAHCRECPVSFECDRLATTERERWGVWGGIDRSAGIVTQSHQRAVMVKIWTTAQPDHTPTPVESCGNGRLTSLPMPTQRMTLPAAKRGAQPQHGSQSSYRRGCRCVDCVTGHDTRRFNDRQQRLLKQGDELAALRAERAHRDDMRRNAAGEAWA
jgi:hypothetical protein